MDDLLLSLPPPLLAEVKTAYAQPPRAYHNFAHVQALLHHYRDVAVGPGWQQPLEVLLAVLFHDAIYEAGRSDNELRSAQLAQVAITRWLADRDVDVTRVMALIELTARHGSLRAEELDADAALFLDSDMAILGAPEAVFDAYDRGIAEEYRGKVPGFLFRLNRRRFLKGVLAQPRLFFSDFFHDRYDAAARVNLRRVTA